MFIITKDLQYLLDLKSLGTMLESMDIIMDQSLAMKEMEDQWLILNTGMLCLYFEIVKPKYICI